GSSSSQGSHGIVDDAVSRPVTSADDVAGAHRGNRCAVGEEAVPVGGCDEFGATLAGTVWVPAAHRVGLAKRTVGLAVLVALVAGHDDDRAYRRAGARCVEHVDGAHDVRLECL